MNNSTPINILGSFKKRTQLIATSDEESAVPDDSVALKELSQKYPAIKRLCQRVDGFEAATNKLRADLEAKIDLRDAELHSQQTRLFEEHQRTIEELTRLSLERMGVFKNSTIVALEAAARYSEASNAWQRLYVQQRNLAGKMFNEYIKTDCCMPYCSNSGIIILHQTDSHAGHYVCFECLENLLRTATAAGKRASYGHMRPPSVFACPMCRKEIEINPSGSTASWVYGGETLLQSSWVLPTVQDINSSSEAPQLAFDASTENHRHNLVYDLANELNLPAPITDALEQREAPPPVESSQENSQRS